MKIGYVGFERDFKRLKWDNPEQKFVLITSGSDIVGQNFDCVIRGYDWEHILDDIGFIDRVGLEVYLVDNRLKEMKKAYKHPFKYWLYKIFNINLFYDGK
jgi:hypothetical protein